MTLNEIWEEIKDNENRLLELVCSDDFLMKGTFTEFLEAEDNDYDSVIIRNQEGVLIEILADQIVKIKIEP